ncbi:MAG: amino acid--tRNA ligase-related protein, partial [Clostridia bacterium]|nr:amino acid--tRNA ligase-related protein [Clostridia bacterium]
FGFELNDISDAVKNCGFKVFTDAIENGGSVRAINVNGSSEKFSRKELDSLGEFVKTYRAKGLAWIRVEEGEIKSPVAKFLTDDEMKAILDKMQASVGDLILIVADKNKIVFDSLGALRIEVAKRLGILDPNDFKFLWVTEFPLMEYSEEESRFMAMHHPFTAPMDEDIELMDTDLGKVRAKAYDIILNGTELGGGSLRIYNSELQRKMFDVLQLSENDIEQRFGFLLNAFKYGAPPHGGMAYGLDRLVMLIAGKDSIRDVMAFPKQQNASELMTNAPDFVDAKQLEELYISMVEKKTENEND